MAARAANLGAAILLAAAVPLGCAPAPAAPSAPAAEKPHVESDLSRTTLSPRACKSLGVRSAPAQRRRVQEHLTLTGWVMAEQGSEVVLTAPVGGFIRDPAAPATFPAPGAAVRQGQEVLVLEPVLSPLEQIQLASLRRGVENELAKARESVKIAQLEVQRLEDLHKQQLRGLQDVEQARGRLTHAKEDLAAAEDRLKLFGAGASSVAAVPLKAPRTGTVLTVQASPGQYVQASAPLLAIADLSRLWLRVPIPEHDLPRIDRKASAAVVLRPSGNGAATQPAANFAVRPLALVPQVDPVRHTADLIYELPAAQTALFAKDQMVSVQVPLGQQVEESVVAYGAVLFDAYGGTWVYLDRTADGAKTHLYERRRVELGPSVEASIVVRPALAAGDKVVIEGTAALFSREFFKPPAARAAGTIDDDD